MRKALLLTAMLTALAGAASAQPNAPQAQSAAPPAHRGIFQFDANNDGTLTRAEFDAGRRAEFARLDANHDGSLSRDEGRAGRMHRRGGHGRGHGHGGPGMMMGNADANNDGNITRDEFLAGPIEHFNRLDTNHNGVLEASERPQPRMRQGQSPGAAPGAPPPGAPGSAANDRPRRPNPDTNNDGAISQAEFTAMGATMFDRLDSNHDGRVTQAEAQAMAPRARQPR